MYWASCLVEINEKIKTCQTACANAREGEQTLNTLKGNALALPVVV